MDQHAIQDDLTRQVNCTCFNLRKATRAVTQYYDRMIKPSGLRGTQFTLLAALSEMKAITITHLADFLMMDRTTLTRNLRPLQKQGYIERSMGDDQRRREIRLTPKGVAIYQNAKPLWEKAQSVLITRMGEATLKDLLKALSETVSAVE